MRPGGTPLGSSWEPRALSCVAGFGGQVFNKFSLFPLSLYEVLPSHHQIKILRRTDKFNSFECTCRWLSQMKAPQTLPFFQSTTYLTNSARCVWSSRSAWPTEPHREPGLQSLPHHPDPIIRQGVPVFGRHFCYETTLKILKLGDYNLILESWWKWKRNFLLFKIKKYLAQVCSFTLSTRCTLMLLVTSFEVQVSQQVSHRI